MSTKICEACDQEIGSTEETCPKCATNFAELEETLGVFDRVKKVAEKRAAKKAADDARNAPPAPVVKKKKTFMASLAGKKE